MSHLTNIQENANIRGPKTGKFRAQIRGQWLFPVASCATPVSLCVQQNGNVEVFDLPRHSAGQ